MPQRYRLPYTLSEPRAETEDLYLAEVPSLPGCRAWGETAAEALANLESVAAGFIASCLEHGDPLPSSITQAGELVVTV